MPLLLLTSVALLVAAGFAIDSGNLFLTQLRLQRAVDAGVISAMMSSRQTDDVTLTGSGEAFIRSNMEEYSILSPNSALSLQAAGGILSASARTPARLFLLNALLPGVSDWSTVTASATGGPSRVAVVLALDESGSMAREIECGYGSTCDAEPDNRAAVDGFCRKTCLLSEAVKAFVSKLEPTDFIGLVGFGNTGNGNIPPPGGNDNVNTPIVSCNDLPYDRNGGGGPFTCGDRALNNPITGFQGKLSLLRDNQLTCISCGLAKAKERFEVADASQLLPKNVQRYVVLMSDGAPTRSVRVRGSSHSNYCGYNPTDSNERRRCDSMNPSNPNFPDSCTMRHHFASVIESDRLRVANVTVMGIGFGLSGENWCLDQNPPFQTCGDPLVQGLSYTRPPLFRRMTNSVAGHDAPYVPRSPYEQHTECIPRTGPSYPTGIFLEGLDAEGLARAFEQIFDVIKTPRLRE